MTKIIALSLMLALSAPDADKLEKTAIDTIEKVEAGFFRTKTFSADFMQVFHDTAIGEERISTGTVIMAKPLKMKWHYEKQYEQMIYSDGKTISIYVPKDKQVMVEPIGNIVGSRSPILFLAGTYRLSELFYVNLEQEENNVRMGGTVRLVLIPKEESASVTKIVIGVNKEDWLISSFSLYDWTNNRTDVFFTNLKTNIGIEESIFIFNRPKGVEQVEMPRLDFGVE